MIISLPIDENSRTREIKSQTQSKFKTQRSENAAKQEECQNVYEKNNMFAEREKYTVRLSANKAVLFFPLSSEMCVREHRARGACISVRVTTQIKRLNVCVTNDSGACGDPTVKSRRFYIDLSFFLSVSRSNLSDFPFVSIHELPRVVVVVGS